MKLTTSFIKHSDNKALSYEKSNDASSSSGSEYRPPAISIDKNNNVPDKEIKNMNLRLP